MIDLVLLQNAAAQRPAGRVHRPVISPAKASSSARRSSLQSRRPRVASTGGPAVRPNERRSGATMRKRSGSRSASAWKKRPVHRLPCTSSSGCPSSGPCTQQCVCRRRRLNGDGVHASAPDLAGSLDDQAPACAIDRLRTARCRPRLTRSRTADSARVVRAARPGPPRRCAAAARRAIPAPALWRSPGRARPSCPRAGTAAARTSPSRGESYSSKKVSTPSWLNSTSAIGS